MAETKKLTEKELYGVIKDTMSDNAQVVEFCEKKLKQLEDKKNANSKKSAENKAQNEIIKNDILNALMEINEPVTISELQKRNASMNLFSNQKLTHLLTEMANVDKTVVRVVDKKKALYSIAN